MTKEWFVLRSKPHKEQALYQQVLRRDAECYYPRIKVNPVNPRSRKIRPYFPGYLFVNLDLEKVSISDFQWLPFSHGLLSFDDKPATVPDNLIQAIKKRIGDINNQGGERFAGLETGDQITVVDGPFQGYDGIFDLRLEGSERVRIFLNMINKAQLPIQMNVGNIRRKKE